MTDILNRSLVVDILKELLLDVTDLKSLPEGDFEGLEISTDFDLDSLDTIELLTDAETRFNIEIDDEKYSKFILVSQMIEALCEQLNIS